MPVNSDTRHKVDGDDEGTRPVSEPSSLSSPPSASPQVAARTPCELDPTETHASRTPLRLVTPESKRSKDLDDQDRAAPPSPRENYAGIKAAAAIESSAMEDKDIDMRRSDLASRHTSFSSHDAERAQRDGRAHFRFRGFDDLSDKVRIHDDESEYESSDGSTQVVPGAVAVRGVNYRPGMSIADSEVDTSISSVLGNESGAAPIPATLVDDEDMDFQVEKRVRQETDDIASEVQRRILDQAVVADVMEPNVKQPPQESSFNWKKWGVVGVILLIVVAVAVVLGVILSKDSEDKTPAPTVPPTPAPTLPPTSAPTVPPTPAPTGAVQGQLEQEFGPILPGTPQAEALQWLNDIDQLQVTPRTPFRIVKERYIMAVLYYSTDGGNWSEQFGFLGGNSICSWNDGTTFPSVTSGDGIFWDDSDSVTHIKLESNALQGIFPSELTALQSLEILALRDNNIQGTIPTTAGTLSALEVFDLAENFIGGNLPEALFNLPQLESLYLFNNRELSGTLPDTLGTTGGRRLVSLGLSSCRLSGTIPASMANLSSLEFVNLSVNSFSGSIPAFTSPSLEDIFLNDNDLEGEIPTSIGELRSLERIRVSQNNLTGPIPLFTGSTSLTDIWIYENSLTGNLEQFLIPLLSSRNLGSLHVGSNSLVGSIPSFVGNFSGLTNLVVEDNSLGGSLPSEVGRLTILEALEVYNADLIGSIPSEVGLMTALTFLDLAVNNWGGTTVPTEIGNLRLLTALNVALNRHVGVFPTEIGSIPTLERLWLHGNDFSGNLEAVCSARWWMKPIDRFYADCAGPIIQTECSCCTHCCDSDGSNCQEVF